MGRVGHWQMPAAVLAHGRQAWPFLPLQSPAAGCAGPARRSGMRAPWGLAGLGLVLAVVGMLDKKQLSAMQTTTGTVQESSRQVQQHIQQQVEGLMQQARPMPEDQPQDDKN